MTDFLNYQENQILICTHLIFYFKNAKQRNLTSAKDRHHGPESTLSDIATKTNVQRSVI